jgi:hypothetical protein
MIEDQKGWAPSAHHQRRSMSNRLTARGITWLETSTIPKPVGYDLGYTLDMLLAMMHSKRRQVGRFKPKFTGYTFATYGEARYTTYKATT